MNGLYTATEEAIDNFAYACGHHDKDFAQDSLLEVLEHGSKEDIQEVTDEYYTVFRK
ncbi:hypothetical protein [Apilactobacillus timberlakei]|uniref:hypothetical protein n=1 Tax=Apilactobacillus timberlakei TaxID=2008380 RepID=UPI0015E853EF|nr:hypothetical protein [Apilactobacillus timberlakei]